MKRLKNRVLYLVVLLILPLALLGQRTESEGRPLCNRPYEGTSCQGRTEFSQKFCKRFSELMQNLMKGQRDVHLDAKVRFPRNSQLIVVDLACHDYRNKVSRRYVYHLIKGRQTPEEAAGKVAEKVRAFVEGTYRKNAKGASDPPVARAPSFKN